MALMRQMKEQQERNRAAECRRNREIATLKKDQRRAEVRGKHSGSVFISIQYLLINTIIKTLFCK